MQQVITVIASTELGIIIKDNMEAEYDIYKHGVWRLIEDVMVPNRPILAP